VIVSGTGRRGQHRAAIAGVRAVPAVGRLAAELAALAHTLREHGVPTPRTPTDPGVQLTERELQVLRGMSQGKSNGQIARELYLSEDTVKTHARRLFRKLGVRDRAQAVAHGFRRGLVS
jgi:DNA-binding NarL/FixJ family response regulator